MDLLVEPFATNPFMQRALVAGLLTVVATSLVGTWVVLRGLSFISDAMAHGVLPGIAIAYVLGASTTLGAALSGLAMVAGISAVSRWTRLGADVAIGLLFVGMLALGVAIISASGAYATDLSGILFGDAIGISRGDVVVTLVAAVLAVLATVLGYRVFLVLTFSEDKAAALGMRPAVVNAAMLLLVGMTVVAAFRTVGTLLVFALLVAPPASASLLARRVPMMMVVSVVLGAVSLVVGLLVSYHAGLAASPAVAVVAVATFFVLLVARNVPRGRTVPAG